MPSGVPPALWAESNTLHRGAACLFLNTSDDEAWAGSFTGAGLP